MDWTDLLAAEAENKRERLAAELLASAAYGSTAERVQALWRVVEGTGRRFSITAGSLRVGMGLSNLEDTGTSG